MLIVVRPPSAGQECRAPSRRRSRSHPPVLTDAEPRRVQAPRRKLVGLYGSRSCPAEITGVHAPSRQHTPAGPHRSSPAMARRAAHAAGSTVHNRLSAPGAADRYRTSERDR